MKLMKYKCIHTEIYWVVSFLASHTRPEIAHAVNIFSQFRENNGLIYWCGLLKLLVCVNSSKHLKLTLICNNSQITTYSDADFASKGDDGE